MTIETIRIPNVETGCIRCGRLTTRAVVRKLAITWYCGRCEEAKP